MCVCGGGAVALLLEGEVNGGDVRGSCTGPGKKGHEEEFWGLVSPGVMGF